MAFGVPHTQACSVLPTRRRPPSLGQKTEDRILGAAALCCGLCPRMHSLRTQPARAVPTDLRHVHPALSSPQLTASCLAGDVSVAAVCSVFCFCECKQLQPHRKRQRRPGHCGAVVSVAAENQVDIRSAVCCLKKTQPIRIFVTGASVALLPFFPSSNVAYRPGPRGSAFAGNRVLCLLWVPSVCRQCDPTQPTAHCCALPAFPGALRRYLQTIRDPCPPANAETPDQDPRRLIPRSIILSPSSHLRLSTPSFHRLSAAALPPGRISPSRPTDLLFAHTTPAS